MGEFILDNKEYLDDVIRVAELDLPWNKMIGKNLIITGATGMMGRFLIDVIMYRNKNKDMNCHVTALGRSETKLYNMFKEYVDDSMLTTVEHDLNQSYEKGQLGYPDYVIHLASNTHPLAYSKDPIGTITINIIGLYNLLEYTTNYESGRTLMASSNEIYGENRGDVEFFNEKYCGYIDSNTQRAGYPESKRCAEALCQAYISQKNKDIVVARLTRSYGPTMNMDDTKAISQFIKNSLNNEDIVLKSEGKQFYSYTYVADAVSGLLYILLLGENGNAYNIADEKSDITLRDLAEVIAGYSGRKVIFQLPDEIEKRGYSTATKARLDGTKIKQLGWTPFYDIKNGMRHTLDILTKQGRGD